MYAQITKQDSYSPINVEQEQHTNQPHQQTGLENIMEKHFQQMKTILNIHTSVLTKLK
jgi:hypothetical protein